MTDPRLQDELHESADAQPLDGDTIADDSTRAVRVEDAWRLELLTTEVKQGDHYVTRVRLCPANVATILRRHPLWRDVVAYDEFRECTCTMAPPPWLPLDAPPVVEPGVWTDEDTARLSAWMSRAEGLDFGPMLLETGLTVAAHARRTHPVRAYLRSVEWDGQPRVDSWLSTYAGADDDLYSRGVGARWLLSAVARIMEPGCQADATLILEGPQGSGKSSALRSLVPVAEWYAESGIDLSNKDSFDALRSVWIYGLDELDSLRKGEITRWKSFLSSPRDHYRPPYARRARDFARQCVFAGTTNESEYLQDRTGNRRFWPVQCGQLHPDDLVRDRDQLWAEAFARYVGGEPWHIDAASGLRLLAEQAQASRVVDDDWTVAVSRWLDRPLVGGTDGYPELADLSAGVTTLDVLVHGLGLRRGDVTIAHTMRAAACLRALGYERGTQARDGRAVTRRYVRTSQDPDPAQGTDDPLTPVDPRGIVTPLAP